MKKYEEAEKDLLRSMKIHNEMGERLGMGMAYNKLGALYLAMNRLYEAEEVLKKGLAFSGEFNIVMIRFKCHYLLYRISQQRGDTEAALRNLEKYLEEKEAVINAQTLKVIENYELISHVREMEREVQLQKEKEEIIRKKDLAEQAARVRQEFLSNMSHEIRTPLNAVASIASLLRDPQEDQTKLLNALQSATDKLTTIVDDILNYHQLDTGKIELNQTPVEPGSVLRELEKAHAPIAEQKGLKLEVFVGEDTAGPYLLDRDKLVHILRHLLDNALKFTSVGHVQITVRKIDK
ncbi:MAG: histidine kinase dimerization/phospho-acceptor domain-containing protein [Owenweeksia sp.]